MNHVPVSTHTALTLTFPLLCIAAVMVPQCRASSTSPHQADRDGDPSSLATVLQATLDTFSNATGFSVAAGWVSDQGESVGVAAGPRTTRGLPVLAPGPLRPQDTFVLGSGSKPYTAAGVMRLVEAGGATLNDSVAMHVDSLLQDMWNTSLHTLFGPMAARVTLSHVLRMESGLADIESSRTWEMAAVHQTSPHSPLGDLQVVSNFSTQPACGNFAMGPRCVWHFEPGTQVEYSSTNFLLACLVLVAHSPQRDWRTFPQAATLEPEFASRYPHTFFPTVGPLHRVGLSTVGNSYSFGRAEIWNQDAGIMGMGWGAATVSAPDMAGWYRDLLAPASRDGARVVSPASQAIMQEWRLLTYGWDNGTKRYGAGLETNNPSPSVQHWRAPPLDHIATGIGHHGGTFGYEVLVGYYPKISAGIAVTINQDSYHDGFLSTLCCQVVEAAARHAGFPSTDLNCTTTLPPVGYCCYRGDGNATHGPGSCVGGGALYCKQSLASCQSSCV
eukprot:m.34706 g.34706  ORF g.34706 m.34706 type:complete len:501 (+) comp5179_c0_seq1:124-1626(+)